MKSFFSLPTVILWTILSLALSVRLVGINYGLPYVFYPDEALLVNHAVAFGTGDLNPHSFIYPSLYMYVLFIVYGMTYVGGRLLGAFSSIDDFIHLFFTDVTIFYLPGRLIAAVSGVVSVWMVYKLGRRAYNSQVGMISAAILSFSVLHVNYSHFVKTHVPAGLFVIATIWFAWSIYQAQSEWRRYCIAGAIAGLGASTIYHAGFALISIVVAHLLTNRRDIRLLDTRLLGAAVSSFVAFVLTTPFALLDWRTFVNELTSTGAAYSADVSVRGTFYPFTSLLSGFGQPLGTVALLGLGYALVRRRPADLILASQPMFVGLFLMLFRAKEAHHMLVAFPAISILAASLVMDTIALILRRRLSLQAMAAAAVTGFLVIAPALKSFKASYRLSLPDTRLLSKAWIEENIPAGSKIVMDSGKYYLGVFGPPLNLSRWTLEQLINRGEASNSGNLARRDGTRRIAYSGEATYFHYQLNAVGDQPGYDIFQVLHEIDSVKIDALAPNRYVEERVQYAIVSSAAAGSHSKYKDFYETLLERGTLIKEFRPSEKVSGPTLHIYRLR
jgi:hypothetical protein